MTRRRGSTTGDNRRIALGWALTVAVVTGCASSVVGPSTAPSRAVAATTPLPTVTQAPSIGPAVTPSIPTELGQIVFDDGSGSHRQIFIEQAGGSAFHQLVVSNDDDVKPRLSPDGRTVIFTRYRPDSSNILVVNVDGTLLREIDKTSCSRPCGGDEDVAWSPDASQVVVTRNLFDQPPNASAPVPPYNIALWLMSADGSGAHQITLNGRVCRNVCKGGAQDNRAAWSPDGRRLVFTRDTYTKPEQFGILTIAIDGSDMRRVTPPALNADDPAWSPDGRLIAFQSPPDPTDGVEQDIYTIHPDGTGLTKLTESLGFGWSNGASFSPDGRQIVFSHLTPDRPSDLYVMNRDGSDLHLLAATDLWENSPNWGPLPTP